jgi:DNA invertase Pin-like site-specific DNA recombinase
LFHRLKGAGAGFCSLTEAIDTTTAAGTIFMQMCGAFAEYERAMIRERTKAGLDAAHAAGRHGGRLPKLAIQQRAAIIEDIEAGRRTAAEAARLFGVSQSTVSRLVAQKRRATGSG